MKNLLYKEFRLCMAVQIPIFFLFVLMMLIPSYPYLVAGFFICNSIFYSFTQAAVDNDVLFTTLLPVSKAQVVASKLRFMLVIELLSLLFFLPMIFVNHAVHGTPNAAGLDASLTLLGALLLVYAVFNAVFLPRFYKAPHKLGRHFLLSTICVFAFIFLFEGFMIICGAAKDALPLFGWVEETLDCFPQSSSIWIRQGIFFAVCAAVYLLGAVLTKKRAQRNFEQVDL